ncbi:unnamed protein product, partial [Polarella glacialis]
ETTGSSALPTAAARRPLPSRSSSLRVAAALPGARQQQRAGAGAGGLPSSLQEDLEDYFARFDSVVRDASSSTGRQGPQSALLQSELPSVPRFEAGDFARLRRTSCSAVTCGARRGPVFTECAICLQSFDESRLTALLELPCSARHVFHGPCLKKWLAKSVQCPVCRVDVKALLPKVKALLPKVMTSSASPASGSDKTRRPFNHQLMAGCTRDGGRVVRYEPNPPVAWPRPTYIPAHLRHLAQYLEVSYPGRGVARIWRLPFGEASGDLSQALPLEGSDH